jgi:peptidoglycan/LPS O-acetylase OafA/YrhL
MHFPLAYMQMAWVKAHASAPIAQHVAVNVSIFALAFAVAWAALKLYDIPARAWLARFPASRKDASCPILNASSESNCKSNQ